MSMGDTADLEHVLDLLAPTVKCRGQKMFGGFGLLCPLGMVGFITKDGRVFLKVDENTRARFADAGGEPFQHRGKKGELMELGYVTPPDQALESADDMQPWAALALGALERRAGKKPASRKKAAPRKKKS